MDLDPIKRAIRIVETSDGLNNVPRLEVAYLPKNFQLTLQGHVYVGTGRSFSDVARERFDEWGPSSAFSFGPWQILYHTAADRGYPGEPWMLWSPIISEHWVVRQLQHLISRGADTPEKLFNAWNTGTHTRISPYLDKYLTAYYARIAR